MNTCNNIIIIIFFLVDVQWFGIRVLKNFRTQLKGAVILSSF